MPLTEKRELGFHSTLADRFFAPPLFSHVHAGRICGRVCLFILGHLHPSHFADLVCTFLSGLLRLIWTQPLSCAGGLSSVTAFGSRLFCPSHLHNVQPWPLALCFGLYFSSPVFWLKLDVSATCRVAESRTLLGRAGWRQGGPANAVGGS